MLRPRAGTKDQDLKFNVELDESGELRFGNKTPLAESGVLGQPLSQPGVRAKLKKLGYSVGDERVARPRNWADLPYRMEPLTVEKVGSEYVVKISERESFAELQARLESGLGKKELAKLAKTRFSAKPNEKVLVVEGIVDTNVTWNEVIGPKQLAQLKAILVKSGGMTKKQAQGLIDGLMDPAKGTIKVIIGTRPARESFSYRSQFAADLDAPIPEGIEVHHFDPLYLGGGHKLLAALNSEAHDAVHRFFDELRLPLNSALGDVSLNPNALRSAAKPLSRPAALVVGPTGEVTYQPL